MGYGFSLFRNPADVYLLAISSKSRQRLMEMKQDPSELGGTHSEAASFIPLNPTETTIPAVSRNQDSGTPDDPKSDVQQVREENEDMVGISSQGGEIQQGLHWVRLKTISDPADQRSQPAYEFSPHFLGECAMMCANKRERTTSGYSLQASVNFSSDELSRNQLHVICSVTMMLQKQWGAITQHDHELPRWPESTKAFHAARYRRNQVQLLNVLITRFLEHLRTLVGIGLLPGRDVRVVRLEHILMHSPQGLLPDFRAALHAGLGTRNPTKIRSKGWVECTFTLWLCGLWSWRTTTRPALDSSRDPIFVSTILNWLGFLERVYGHPYAFKADAKIIPDMSNDVILEESTRAQRGVFKQPDSSNDTVLIAESYLRVVEAALKKNSDSLYGAPSVTIQQLVWCLNIINEEGVMLPNLKGTVDEEADEFILFMETESSF